MKIDRRSFLSFVAGGAAGTALSPLPWKLMDDISIWSQAWPWIPVPRTGESTYSNSICSACPGGCGIVVRKIDDRAVKIEGLPGHSVNDGCVCGLGLSGLQLLYAPTRVKTPMKRIGSRGSRRWQKISWDEAISIVVDKLTLLRSNGEANKVGCISALEHGTVASLLQRFFQAYGSKKITKMPYGPDVNKVVFNALCGNKAAVHYDFENSDFVLSFGSGLLEGWSSPIRMIKASNKWHDDKVEVVQIETKLSNTAAKASKWIPINPGTESDLAFGIAAFMLMHNLYNLEFVSTSYASFNEWKQKILEKYTLDYVSKITGIGIDIIIDLAKSFANATSPIALCGRGNGVMPSSFREYASINLLNVLQGNINKSGGVWLYKELKYIDWPSIILDEVAKVSLGVDDPIDELESSEYLLDNLIFDLYSEKASLKALFVVAANPCYSLSDAVSVRKALELVPFVVSFSSFMDETTVQSDLVLPDHIYLEKFQDIPFVTGVCKQGIGISAPVISAQFNTRHVGDTIIKIAHSFGGTVAASFPWKDYKGCLENTLGNDSTSMSNKVLWFEKNLEPIEVDKFNFIGADLQTIQVKGNIDLFPLVLIPSDSLRVSSGYIASPPFLVKTIDDTVVKGKIGFVDINPQTAEILDLADGDYAKLSTPKGEVEVKVHLYDGIKPGVLTMLRGLGHTAYDEYIAKKGININDLIGPSKDPVLGHDAVWGIRAKLVKA